MDSLPFLERVAPAMTDPAVRALWLSDPRAALLQAGIDLPSWADVHAVEGERLGLSVTLGPLIDLDGELSEEHLGDIAGGASTGASACGSYACYQG